MSLLVNPAYAPDTLERSDPSRAAEARAFHEALPGYAPTPVHELAPGVFLKDESDRLGLPAFKVLGASWAIESALRGRGDVHTLVAASAGNHGRAVAHVAGRRGLAAKVFLPERARPARRAAIEGEGAEVVVGGTYEDAVALAAAEGRRDGFLELADVGEGGGPAEWVIEGYATLFAELAEQASFAALIVPAGVGSLAAAAARFGAQAGVEVWVVEPETAACVTASLAAGAPTAIDNPGTAMAGLDCAEVSAAAWPSLRAGVRGTITVSDEQARAAMDELAARGLAIGDCGAAPLAALPLLDVRPVALIATEGLTG
ncbi:MAG: pyridoxal-phosphate dependent enzyme [Solirubrobacteraceae bacterium]